MDKLKAMQIVVSIADEGSLTAAAAALGSSPPAVVRTLAALEAHLGIRLFNQRAVFASKQRELLPTVLMPGSITCGLYIFFSVLIFKKLEN